MVGLKGCIYRALIRSTVSWVRIRPWWDWKSHSCSRNRSSISVRIRPWWDWKTDAIDIEEDWFHYYFSLLESDHGGIERPRTNHNYRIRNRLESDHGGIESLDIRPIFPLLEMLESDHGGIERILGAKTAHHPARTLESDHGGIESPHCNENNQSCLLWVRIRPWWDWKGDNLLEPWRSELVLESDHGGIESKNIGGRDIFSVIS